ncbi:MAG: hypothetical protein LN413_00200 [Candidatus Thermoplasmatota archaeon]|nr:hypothetical protein [Candidatus Thermoplasmatota archaeon]
MRKIGFVVVVGMLLSCGGGGGHSSSGPAPDPWAGQGQATIFLDGQMVVFDTVIQPHVVPGTDCPQIIAIAGYDSSPPDWTFSITWGCGTCLTGMPLCASGTVDSMIPQHGLVFSIFKPGDGVWSSGPPYFQDFTVDATSVALNIGDLTQGSLAGLAEKPTTPPDVRTISGTFMAPRLEP